MNRSAGPIDFSLLTDGLRAEREQGITIDVAYRYFCHAAAQVHHRRHARPRAVHAQHGDRRIHGRPGDHPDRRAQRRAAAVAPARATSRRCWAFRHFVVAVNKMDLVDYSAEVFDAIEAEFREFLAQLNAPHDCTFIPISALDGDNVVARSREHALVRRGPACWNTWRRCRSTTASVHAAFRFPVQCVIRPDQDFRGYAGQSRVGRVRPGDAVWRCPPADDRASRASRRSMATLDEAVAPMSVTLTLEDELDISRGDMLASIERIPEVARQFEASLVWINDRPLKVRGTYLLKHTTQTLPARSDGLRISRERDLARPGAARTLEMNGIGVVRIETSRPLYFDPYVRNRTTGSFILIDPETNATVAAGMILGAVPAERARTPVIVKKHGRVTPAERMARYGHSRRPFTGPPGSSSRGCWSANCSIAAAR